MRRSVTPVVPPSMYRHFAVVTVLLTAILAMFAEAENRQAQAALATRQAPAVSSAAPRIVAPHHAPQPVLGWEVNSSSDGGNGSVGSDSGASPGFEDIKAPGYAPEYVASLSEEERELLLAGIHESGMMYPAVRDSSSADLIAASSRRSGSASNDD